MIRGASVTTVRIAIASAAALLACASFATFAACGGGSGDGAHDVADGSATSDAGVEGDAQDGGARVDAGSDADNSLLPCDAGGRCLVTLARVTGNPYDIAVDGTNVYFTVSPGNIVPGGDAGLVMRVGLDGGTATQLGSALLPDSVVVDATSVYWLSTGPSPGSALVAPIAGGPTKTLANGLSGPFALALDDTKLYITNQGGDEIDAVPLDGGAVAALVSQSLPLAIAVDATGIFFTANGGAVMKAPLDGGTALSLASGQGTGPPAIAVDATSVYFSTLDKIVKVAKSGGTPVTLASGFANVSDIALDATHVYFTDGVSNRTDGTVMKVPIAGGKPTVLAFGQSMPFHIAVDATSVYFTNYDDGTIVKIRPK